MSERNNLSKSESLCAPMPPKKFRLNLTYDFGGDIV